jgi:antitoxin VapB
MGEEYIAKTFKSGNSVAMRLPKGLGIKEGVEMKVREERGKFIVEPVEAEPRMIDLTGIYGAIPGIERMPFDEVERNWGVLPDA